MTDKTEACPNCNVDEDSVICLGCNHHNKADAKDKRIARLEGHREQRLVAIKLHLMSYANEVFGQDWPEDAPKLAEIIEEMRLLHEKEE